VSESTACTFVGNLIWQ